MSGSLFSPELWEKLKTHPETSELLKDPSFQSVIDDLRNNPSSLANHLSDKRFQKLLKVMATQGGASGSQVNNANMNETVVEDESDDTPNVEKKDKAMPDVSEAQKPVQPKKEATPAEQALVEKERGTEAYKKRDFSAAISAYTSAIELDPDNMSFLTNRAAAKLESGDVDGCIEDCKKAIEENANRHLRTDFKIIARAYGRMGNAYLRKDDYDNAISSFEKSLVEFSDPKVRTSLKDAEMTKRKKEEEAYINPEISSKVRQEGNELFKAGKFPESIAKYSDAIKRNPNDAAPYSNRAAAYMKLGEFPMAMKDCDKCLEIDPSFVKAYIRKGNIHFFMKEYHKCLTVFEKGLKLAPDNKELKQGLFKTNMKIQEQQSSNEIDEAQMQQAMKDPEIQQILQDPQMQTLLKQMQEDPKFAAQAMRDPTISSKVQKLVASGFLRVG